jgi:hypothetical protein
MIYARMEARDYVSTVGMTKTATTVDTWEPHDVVVSGSPQLIKEQMRHGHHATVCYGPSLSGFKPGIRVYEAGVHQPCSIVPSCQGSAIQKYEKAD